MPIERHKDSKGPYFQVHNATAILHYISGNKKSREIAYNKAKRQLVAIEISKKHRIK
jgi:hypothetical protein